MRQLRSQQQITNEWRDDPDKPVVSICCITYNHAPYIEDTLEGFLNQETDFPFEILIHDDASTDHTTTIIKEYEVAYPKLIKPIYQAENQYSKGYKINSEFNFPRARGEYIALCEGDDYWTDPQKLQKQVHFLDEHNAFSMTTHAVSIIDDTITKNIYNPYYPAPKTVSGFEDVLFEHFIPTLSIVFRKACLPKAFPKFSSDVISMDKALALILTSKGLCNFTPRVMGCYRHHDGGITKNKEANIKSFRKREYALYRQVFSYLQNKPESLLRLRLARVDFFVSLMYLGEKSYLEAISFLIKSIAKDPLILFKMLHRRNVIKISKQKMPTINSSQHSN